MSKRFMLYGHGGSYNHGAEAIVKCTIRYLRNEYPDAYIILSSNFPEQDKIFYIDADEIHGPDINAWSAEKIAPSADKERLAYAMYSTVLEKITSDTTLLSVGGDNYCYPTWHRLAVFQKEAVRLNAKSILWSASIEPSVITPEMLDILNTYDEITVREHLTYDALKSANIRGDIRLVRDIAFKLEPAHVKLPQGFISSNFVGLNISPLVARKELIDGIIMKNFYQLIINILTKSTQNIALIPHVVMPVDNDYDILSKLYNVLPKEIRARIWLVGEHLSAAEYKYVISQCSALIACRTHACIAAYSTGVPCLAIGYSVKAQGIADDLNMGAFVINVSDIREEDMLIKKYHKLTYRE